MKFCRYNQYQIRVLNARVCVMSFRNKTQHQVPLPRFHVFFIQSSGRPGIKKEQNCSKYQPVKHYNNWLKHS